MAVRSVSVGALETQTFIIAAMAERWPSDGERRLRLTAETLRERCMESPCCQDPQEHLTDRITGFDTKGAQRGPWQ